MKARLIETKEVRVACPNCGEPAGSVTHLLEERGPRHFGPWYCDECGRGYSGEIQADGGIELRLEDKMLVRTLDHLVLPPQTRPVHFLVEGMDFVDAKGNRRTAEEKRFFYEEHSCPTNYVRCEVIAVDGDRDPHGLFKYVGTSDLPKDYDADEDYGDGPASMLLASFKAPAD